MVLQYFEQPPPFQRQGILVDEFRGAFGKIPGHILTSVMQLTDSTLIIHYKLEEYIEKYNTKQEIISTCQFTEKFIYHNNRFETDEMN